MYAMRIVLIFLSSIFACSAWAIVDCSKAKSNFEKMACSSTRAAAADQQMALAFRTAFARTADRVSLLADQKRWQEAVRDRCPDVDCLIQVHRDRIDDLEDIQK